MLLTWDATQGMRFYDNGALKYSTWGKESFAPATPSKIAVGASGPRERPQWTNCADAIYDELIMLDRAVSDDEVALLMEGRYDELDRPEPAELTDAQLAQRRNALLIEDDVAVSRLRRTLPLKPTADGDVLRVTLPHAYEPTVFYLSADVGLQFEGDDPHSVRLDEYAFLWLLSGDEKLAAAMEKYLDAHSSSLPRR